MTVDEETEKELYGISPWLIGEIMILISLFTPLGIVPSGNIIVFNAWLDGPFIYGLLWVLLLGHHYYVDLYEFLNLPYLWALIPLSVFSFLYIRQIIRYYFGKSSRDIVIATGLMSVIFPTVVALIFTIPSLEFYYVGFIIPIPIQFLVGLIFIRKFDGPEVISPWAGQFIDWSWWGRLKSRLSRRTSDIIELHLQEEEELDWLDSE